MCTGGVYSVFFVHGESGSIVHLQLLSFVLVVAYLRERPGELHVFGSCVAALQQPGSAVHVHQTLVVVIVDRRTQHSQVKLLGAGVVDILLGNGNRD